MDEEGIIMKIKLLGIYERGAETRIMYRKSGYSDLRTMGYTIFKKSIIRPISKEKLILEELKQ
jgi:hypothetical protein